MISINLQQLQYQQQQQQENIRPNFNSSQPSDPNSKQAKQMIQNESGYKYSGATHSISNSSSEQCLIGGQSMNIPSGSQSHRRISGAEGGHGGSALQSLFMNTLNSTQLGLGSALQSARQYNGSTLSELNLESTQELKNFGAIDLTKINKERQDHMRQALDDNMKEKQQELQQIESSYKQNKEEYDQVSLKYKERNQKLEEETQKQRNYLSNLKTSIRAKDQELQAKEEQYQKDQKSLQAQLKEGESKNSNVKQELQQLESTLSLLQMQRKGYQMSIEMSKKVKVQELDLKLVPIDNEKDKASSNLLALKDSLLMLTELYMQTENEKLMIQEDLVVSDQIKVDLVFQREELEGFIEDIKQQNEDIRFVHELLSFQQSQYQPTGTRMMTTLQLLNSQSNGGQVSGVWDYIKQQLIQQKERELLLNLIRELQQYLLGFSSNTTDNSVMQSEDLEDLQMAIENKSIETDKAIQIICEFASNKMKLDLNEEQLTKKICQISEQIDFSMIRQSIEEIENVEFQAIDLDKRIKVIYNRVQNELRPKYKALDKSEQSFSQEIQKAKQQYQELEDYLKDLDDEIIRIKQNFEQTYQANSQDFTEMEENLTSINIQIQDIEYRFDNLKQEVSQFEEVIQNLQSQIQSLEISHSEYSLKQKQEIKQLKDDLKLEQTRQNEQESNPKVNNTLSLEVAQLKCDKESAYKRLKYVENKLQNAVDSLNHAKSVFDNHQLQQQQDNLNLVQKRQTGSLFEKFNANGLGLRKGSNQQIPQLISQMPQNARVNMIEQKANSLVRGKIISPTKEEIIQDSESEINIEYISDQQLISDKESMVNQRDSPSHQSSSQSSLLQLQQHNLKQSNSTIKPKQLTYNQLDTERMHDHFIGGAAGQQQQQQQPIQQKQFQDRRKSSINTYIEQYSSSKKQILQPQHNEENSSQNLLQHNKSTIDVVRYYYDSSSMGSSQEETQPLRQIKQQKTIPCQQLITPRDIPSSSSFYGNFAEQSYDTQQPRQEVQNNFIYESMNSQASFDSMSSQETATIIMKTDQQLYRKNSFKGNLSSSQDTTINAYLNTNNNHYLRNQRITSNTMASGAAGTQSKISLKNNNSSYDGGKQQSRYNQPLYAQFKENIMPNQGKAVNLKRLSQCPNISSIRGVGDHKTNYSSFTGNSSSINNVSSAQTSNLQNNRPSPAVPQSKQDNNTPRDRRQSSCKRASFYKQQLMSGNTNCQKPPTQQQNVLQKKANSFEENFNTKVVQKIRLNLNIKNCQGRPPLQVGAVDLVKCHQSQRDQAFFENVKPLIEGSQFLMLIDNQLVLKQTFLDFSLLRIQIDNYSGIKEVIMVESIIKPELPNSTLELIRQEKNQNLLMLNGGKSSGSSQKRYEFNLIVSHNQIIEKIQLFAMSYDELKKWIVGINALISTKTSLTRLSSLISY